MRRLLPSWMSDTPPGADPVDLAHERRYIPVVGDRLDREGHWLQYMLDLITLFLGPRDDLLKMAAPAAPLFSSSGRGRTLYQFRAGPPARLFCRAADVWPITRGTSVRRPWPRYCLISMARTSAGAICSLRNSTIRRSSWGSVADKNHPDPSGLQVCLDGRPRRPRALCRSRAGSPRSFGYDSAALIAPQSSVAARRQASGRLHSQRNRASDRRPLDGCVCPCFASLPRA